MIPKSERTPTPTTDFFDKALELYRVAVEMCDRCYSPKFSDDPMYWHMVDMRNSILSHMDSMISNLTHANKIYILSRFDYDEDVENQFKSWYGNIKKYNNFKSCQDIKRTYKELFGKYAA